MSRLLSSSILFLALMGLSIPSLVAPTSALAGANDGFDPSSLDEITRSVKQISLTEDMVNRLLKSYPEMRKASAQFDSTELPERPPAADSGKSDLDAMPSDKRKALEQVAKRYGFKDLDEWSTVASSVVMSYAYAMQGKKPGSLEEAVKTNIEHAKSDPSLSEEEKEKMVAQYEALGTKLAKLEPLKENYDLILKMKEQVTPMMEAR